MIIFAIKALKNILKIIILIVIIYNFNLNAKTNKNILDNIPIINLHLNIDTTLMKNLLKNYKFYETYNKNYFLDSNFIKKSYKLKYKLDNHYEELPKHIAYGKYQYKNKWYVITYFFGEEYNSDDSIKLEYITNIQFQVLTFSKNYKFLEFTSLAMYIVNYSNIIECYIDKNNQCKIENIINNNISTFYLK